MRRLGACLVAICASAAVSAPARAQMLPMVVGPTPVVAPAASSQAAPANAPADGGVRQILPGMQSAAGPTSAPAGAPAAPLKLDATALPLGGALKNPELWTAYKGRFVTDQGRVVDTANGLISHSEGQGYGMLLAVAAKDRVAFDRIWGWTRANLMVRDDQLLAWRWEPNGRPAVADMNDATDGDILVAWALTEAGELWGDVAYRIAARRIAVEVARKTVITKTRFGQLLLPAVAGFSAEDRQDGPVVNLSYWVFPAFARLSLVAPEVDWSGVSQTGLDLIKAARFGQSGLPTEWVSARGDTLKPAENFAQVFSYNAIRIPLYMAWAGIGEREHYAPFLAIWRNRSTPLVASIDTQSGRRGQAMSEPGYGAVADLTLCVADGKPLPPDFRSSGAPENYYPATLRLMTLIAAEMRYPSCLRG